MPIVFYTTTLQCVFMSFISVILNRRSCRRQFVAQHLTSAISEIRVDEWRRLKKLWGDAHKAMKACQDPDQKRSLRREALKLQDNYLLVKNSQKLLVTSPYNEKAYWNHKDDIRHERLEQISRLSPSITFARDALMEFYDIIHLDEFRDRHDGLTNWLKKYLACDCPPVRQAASSIKIHRKGIENAWRYKKSNSPTEGLNKKIKDVKRMAFGAHSFENFRKRALLACGATTFIHHTYTVGKEAASAGEELYIPGGSNSCGH